MVALCASIGRFLARCSGAPERLPASDDSGAMSSSATIPPPAYARKIAAGADALARIRALPRPLVMTNGVFDVLHRGHVTYLDQARGLGAALVVAVNSDASVRRLGKGDDRPLNPLADRMAVLAALEAVDGQGRRLQRRDDRRRRRGDRRRRPLCRDSVRLRPLDHCAGRAHPPRCRRGPLGSGRRARSPARSRPTAQPAGRRDSDRGDAPGVDALISAGTGHLHCRRRRFKIVFIYLLTRGQPAEAMDTLTRGRIKPRHRLTTEERQREIVASVLALARERGPEAITTQAIAERMRVTQGALFRHFPDKEAIWLAVFAWVRNSLEAVLATAVAQADSPLARLEATFHAHVAFIAANPGVPRIVFHELQYPDDSPVRAAVRAMVVAYRRRLAQLFTQAKAAGELPANLDAALAPVLFLGAIQGLVMQSALLGDEVGMAKQGRQLFPLLLHGYQRGRAT